MGKRSAAALGQDTACHCRDYINHQPSRVGTFENFEFDIGRLTDDAISTIAAHDKVGIDFISKRNPAFGSVGILETDFHLVTCINNTFDLNGSVDLYTTFLTGFL